MRGGMFHPNIRRTSHPYGLAPLSVVVAASFALVVTMAASGQAAVTLLQVSADPFTNTTSYHATEVEPDSFASGSTVVAAFQVGRFPNGGSSDIGFATSTDGGTIWTHGFLPGTTPYSTPPGPYARISDPSVAFDKAHGVWMISALPLGSTISGVAVVVSRSTDGGSTWGSPVTVQQATPKQDFDKNWTTCDDTPTSPFFGHCYTEWDDFAHGDLMHMATSTDGGLTWTEATVPSAAHVIGAEPVVQPTGVVVVPTASADFTKEEAFTSTDGGLTYQGPFKISGLKHHPEAGTLRAPPMLSAAVDASGRVYVVWSDCRFEPGCKANDLVLATSRTGTSWTAPAPIPIDSQASGVDHFLPGLAAAPGTAGSRARLGLMYYFYPQAACTVTTCQLEVGFTGSPDGGARWSKRKVLTGPISLPSLPFAGGFMVGDYFTTTFSGGAAHPIVMTAAPGTCTLGEITSCDEFAATPTGGISALSGLRPIRTEQVVASGPVLSVSGPLSSR